MRGFTPGQRFDSLGGFSRKVIPIFLCSTINNFKEHFVSLFCLEAHPAIVERLACYLLS